MLTKDMELIFGVSLPKMNPRRFFLPLRKEKKEKKKGKERKEKRKEKKKEKKKKKKRKKKKKKRKKKEKKKKRKEKKIFLSYFSFLQARCDLEFNVLDC